jgi:hypothetical protein
MARAKLNEADARNLAIELLRSAGGEHAVQQRAHQLATLIEMGMNDQPIDVAKLTELAREVPPLEYGVSFTAAGWRELLTQERESLARLLDPMTMEDLAGLRVRLAATLARDFAGESEARCLQALALIVRCAWPTPSLTAVEQADLADQIQQAVALLAVDLSAEEVQQLRERLHADARDVLYPFRKSPLPGLMTYLAEALKDVPAGADKRSTALLQAWSKYELTYGPWLLARDLATRERLAAVFKLH